MFAVGDLVEYLVQGNNGTSTSSSSVQGGQPVRKLEYYGAEVRAVRTNRGSYDIFLFEGDGKLLTDVKASSLVAASGTWTRPDTNSLAETESSSYFWTQKGIKLIPEYFREYFENPVVGDLFTSKHLALIRKNPATSTLTEEGLLRDEFIAGTVAPGSVKKEGTADSEETEATVDKKSLRKDYRWTKKGITLIPPPFLQLFGNPSDGDQFAASHLALIQQNPKSSSATYEGLLKDGCISLHQIEEKEEEIAKEEEEEEEEGEENRSKVPELVIEEKEEGETTCIGYQWTQRGIDLIPDPFRVAFGNPASGDSFSPHHLSLIRQNPKTGHMTYSTLIEGGFIVDLSKSISTSSSKDKNNVETPQKAQAPASFPFPSLLRMMETVKTSAPPSDARRRKHDKLWNKLEEFLCRRTPSQRDLKNKHFIDIAGEDSEIDREEFDILLRPTLLHVLLDPIISHLLQYRQFLESTRLPSGIIDGIDLEIPELQRFVENLPKIKAHAPVLLDHIFGIIDKDGSGALDKREWGIAVEVVHALADLIEGYGSPQSMENIPFIFTKLFNLFDDDSNGRVSVTDFLKIAKEMLMSAFDLLRQVCVFVTSHQRR